MKAFLIIVLVIVMLCCMVSCYTTMTYSHTESYNLTEIEEGIYGYYTVVTSNIPAENYQMITLSLNGNVYTLDGQVNIHYADNEHRFVWTDTELRHGDTIDVYAPLGSIIFCSPIRQTR